MERVAVEVMCFAGLRKYFGNSITVFVGSEASFYDIIDEMIRMKPDAEEVLTASRIAVNEEFVSPEEKIKSERALILIPPSSGG